MKLGTRTGIGSPIARRRTMMKWNRGDLESGLTDPNDLSVLSGRNDLRDPTDQSDMIETILTMID
jgi:hypothetical protein